jgi:uncharacterized protein YndB with AHSA1/START domain
MAKTANEEVNVRDRILKAVNEVFDAFIDPEKMSRYFIAGASDPMKAGTTVEWEFADLDVKVSVDVPEIEQNRKNSRSQHQNQGMRSLIG